jgi:ElaA protein
MTERYPSSAIRCRLVRFSEAEFAECAAIRHTVFVAEQHVPVEEEMDELDAQATHVLATVGEESAGTGRLILMDGSSAKVGRMAVLPAHRGRGVGSAILQTLLDAARERGVRHVSLASQLQAIPFYRRFGFVEEGEEFFDAGIRHRMMTCQLGQDAR